MPGTQLRPALTDVSLDNGDVVVSGEDAARGALEIAKTTPTVCCGLSVNADRWLRVAVYGAAVALTSCLFAGWQQYSLILLKGGVYAWSCSPDTYIESDEVPGLFTCPDQERQVNGLLPLASGFELAGAIVAGVALDFTGPRLCGALGSITGFLSYVMLIYSNSKVNLYGLSMAVTGVAINLIGFPALTLEDYFPTAAATTAAYVIACQCLSSIISVLLWEIWQSHPHVTFKQLWWLYLFIVWIPVSIPYVALLPTRRLGGATGGGGHGGGGHMEVSATTGVREHFSFKKLLRLVGSAPYIAMNSLSIILMLQTSYWQLIVRSQLGIKISEILGYTMPTQAIWALTLGRLTDFTGTPVMICFLHLLYSVIYGLVGLGKSNVQYLSVMLFNIAMSYAYTIKYSYVQERFPQRYYGTLVGLSGALSGAGVLTTEFLNLLDEPVRISIALACITVLAIPICVWLHFDLRRYYEINEEIAAREAVQAPSSRHSSNRDVLLSPLEPKFAMPEITERGPSNYYQRMSRGSFDNYHIPTQAPTDNV